MNYTMYKIHVEANSLYISLKAFFVSCQNLVLRLYRCPRNIFCCETVIHFFEYVTPWTPLKAVNRT
jgi:hypothetical protein